MNPHPALYKLLQVFSEVGPQHAQLAQQAWRWRELLERAINGSHGTDHISASGLAMYDDLEGPFAAIPAGYQVREEK